MTKPSRNLWNVHMEHRTDNSLWILASTAEIAAKKAIAFSKREDPVKNSLVTAVTFAGTIDAF